jgi:hypothetical protein
MDFTTLFPTILHFDDYELDRLTAYYSARKQIHCMADGLSTVLLSQLLDLGIHNVSKSTYTGAG